MRFFVFEIWSFLYSKLVSFSMNFEYKIDHNSKNINRKNRKIYFFIRCSTVRIYYKKESKTERGGLHTLSWETEKSHKMYRLLSLAMFWTDLNFPKNTPERLGWLRWRGSIYSTRAICQNDIFQSRFEMLFNGAIAFPNYL